MSLYNKKGCRFTPGRILRTKYVYKNITGPYIWTNPNFRSIYTSQCALQLVSCNTVTGTTNGIEFAGINAFTRFTNNTMSNHQYGYVLSYNAILGYQGVIGTQGAVGKPSDNIWIPDIWPLGTFKTATLSSSSQNSKLYIRNSISYNPNLSGTTDLNPLTDLYSNSNGSLIYTTGPPTSCFSPLSPVQNHSPILKKIVMDSINFNGPDSLKTSYIYKNKIFRILKDNPMLMDSSTVLANFYMQSLTTTREIYTVIEDSMAVGALSASQIIVNGLSPQNSIEENYKNFFKLYLKHKVDSLNAADSIDLIDLAQLCPFTDGDVIYQARAFYNAVYTMNIFFQDLCPQNIEGKSMEINSPSGNEFDVLVYPNPGNGDMFILPLIDNISSLNIKLLDINGKEIYIENLKPIDGVFSLKIQVADGTYLLYVSCLETGEYVTKRIIIKK